jgi:hypothetical protein
MRRPIIVIAIALAACSNGGETINQHLDSGSTEDGGDATALVDFQPSPDIAPSPDTLAPDGGLDIHLDAPADIAPDGFAPGCAPGEGCFLDPCDDNGDCLSGWCVEHMGDSVCTQVCQEECPPGWSCKLLGGGGPDPIYACVSDVSNLCKPCASSADCKAPGAQEDVCVDYETEGSFCGGGCTTSEDCPWGLSCLTTDTVDGISTLQCVADAGVCPCSSKSVSLGLWTPCGTTTEFGTCGGKRVCTDSGLSECDAPDAIAESCNGVDDDCDGDVDEPTAQGGDLVNLCDDDNPCTVDTCLGPDGCQQENLEAGECIDGDSCTIGDHCEEGVCMGTPIDCDDSDPCTDDACDGLGGCQYEDNAADCDDGNECTVADECDQGQCSGFAVQCDCKVDEDCATFEDGDLCNGTLYCDTASLPYQCRVAGETIVECEPLAGEDAKCNTAKCNPASGDCAAQPVVEGIPCDNGDSCTVAESCIGGSCQGGQLVNCNDGNPCTDDACEAPGGCTNIPNDKSCEDGDVCTAGDLCQDGICKAGQPVNCDDASPCTADSCVPATGCLHAPTDGACDDGNLCTNGDHCVGGDCLYDGVVLCDDNNVCTSDSCDPVGGCSYKLNSAPCDDNDLCTTGDYCHLGECISSATLPCDDGNSCTNDACAPDSGCSFVPNSEECSDGTDCTVGDKCSSGWCLPGPTLDCSDDNPCTDDSCDPQDGCVNLNNSLPCTDGDACTDGDICSSGTCSPGQALDCNDDSPCTIDSCDPGVGCKNLPLDGECDDGNECTDGDICAQGLCVSGNPVTCDDANGCTDDGCAPDSGCLFVPNDAECSDDSMCTVGDKCGGGVCVPGGALDCNDNKACTDDSCDANSGCTNVNVQDGTECGQDLVCVNGECTNCGQLNGSTTFNYTGNKQTFTVPVCITEITVTASGAESGKGQKGAPGKGGRVVATISVTPGETLSVYVGNTGAPGSGASGGAGGYNGGGNGAGYGNTCYTGGGGGGASDVRRGGDGLSHRVVVAGGGGGGGGDPATCDASWGGGGGGLTGQDGQHSISGGIDSNGKGGTQTDGGAGGNWNDGNNGGWGIGGNGGKAGGGGGGGCYGGGGGGHGGAGGGSSYAAPGSTNVSHQQGVQSNNGQVAISW